MHVSACTDKGYTTINLLEEEKEEKTLSYLNSGGLVVYGGGACASPCRLEPGSDWRDGQADSPDLR